MSTEGKPVDGWVLEQIVDLGNRMNQVETGIDTMIGFFNELNREQKGNAANFATALKQLKEMADSNTASIVSQFADGQVREVRKVVRDGNGDITAILTMDPT